MMTLLLYVIRLPTDDYSVAYVGVTKNLRQRKHDHWFAKTTLGSAIRACGRGNAIFEVIERGDREYIFERERQMIVEYNTRNELGRGYNRASGGFGCRDPLPSTRRKISEASIITNTGRRHSKESYARQAAAVRGVKKTAAHRAALSAAALTSSLVAAAQAKATAAAAIANTGKTAWNKGKPISEATRSKISAAGKGRIAWNRGIKASAETRAKLSAMRKGRRRKPFSAEHLANMSRARKGKPWTAAQRAAHL